MTEHSIQTEWGKKSIKVYCGDVTALPNQVDLLVCSAFKNGYSPTPSSLIGSLYRKYGISVEELSRTPSLNLKDLGIWVSQPLHNGRFKRIACVEILSYYEPSTTTDELRSLYDNLFFAVKKCKMIDFPVKAIAMPVLGTGVQRIEFQKSLIPLLTECMSALKTIQGLQNIILFDKDSSRCRMISEMLRKSTPNTGECMAFISYSHSDQDIANQIANELEINGIKPWIDHKMIRNANYAEDIVKGISESKVFLLLVSRDSLQSPDVRREVRNASVYFDKGVLKIVPVILESVPYPPEYSYYLTGIDYKDISKPPREQKIQMLCKELHDQFASSSSESTIEGLGINNKWMNEARGMRIDHSAGDLTDFVHWNPQSNDLFAYKFPQTRLSPDTQLIVRESQEAVLFSNGQIMGKFGPGKHSLSSKNSFSAEVWFINKAVPLNIEWKTDGMKILDPDYIQRIPIFVKGSYDLKITDAERFLIQLEGTLASFTAANLTNHFKGKLVSKTKSAIASFVAVNNAGINYISGHLSDLSEFIQQPLSEFWEGYGFALEGFYITTVDVDTSTELGRKIEQAIASRSAQGIAGYTWQQAQAAEVAKNAASNGTGMGGMMAAAMLMGNNGGRAMGMGSMLMQPQYSTMQGQMPHSRDAQQMHQQGDGQMTPQVWEVICDRCGKKIPIAAKFCLYCGNKLFSPIEGKKEDNSGEIDETLLSDFGITRNDLQRNAIIFYSAVVPKSMERGEYSVIQIVVYDNKYRPVIDAIISQYDDCVTEIPGSVLQIRHHSKVEILLRSPDLELYSDGVIYSSIPQIWEEGYLNFSFGVLLPECYSKRHILFIADVYVNGMIASKLSFVATISAGDNQKLSIQRNDILTAFVSYASEDRSRVASIIQGMNKARPDMDIFFDVENLRSGEEWEQVLFKEIDKRDVFFLCWSLNSSKSKYVENEWRHALHVKGIDFIDPIPLDPPEICPPPEELKKKHFNDRRLYVSRASP